MTPEVMVTTSKDIISSLGNKNAPEKSLIMLGYAGWTAGQLEEEIQTSSWLMVEADTEILFDTPIHKKWETAVQRLGIDVWQLGPDIGHA
jgi:putative transcriptional regulator